MIFIALPPLSAYSMDKFNMSYIYFGDISNIIESIGGRFFGFKELRQATNIFFSQIDYVSNEKNKPSIEAGEVDRVATTIAAQ